MKLKNKKSLVILCVCILCLLHAVAASTTDSVVINQVLYDPIRTESGGEAVELYNPSNSEINISGFILKTESSATDVTLPANTFIAARGYYLIADAGWNASKDNLSWPGADHEEAISLTNSNAGVALIDMNNNTIDAVGWGDQTQIDTGLYKGTPTVKVNSGFVINRINFTNNNVLDFIAATPMFHNASYQLTTNSSNSSGTKIELKVNISNSIPTIHWINITPDANPSKNLTQVLPFPGSSKNITFQVFIEDLDGLADINQTSALLKQPNNRSTNISLEKIANPSFTTALFEGVFELPFYSEPGTYGLLINVSDPGTSVIENSSFEVLELSALELDSSSLVFPGAKLGSTATLLGDVLFGTTFPTLKNIGNTKLDLGIYGTDLADGDKKIDVNNLKFSFDLNLTSVKTLSTSLQVDSLNLAAGPNAFAPVSFQLYVPPKTKNGEYAGAITLVGVAG